MNTLVPQVEVTSRLESEAEVVWEGISSLEGVNLEMGPWLRMTAPAGAGLADATGGQTLNLALSGPGGLPLGNYPLDLNEFEEGRGFLEQTWMFPFLLWQHERVIESGGDGLTFVTDRLGWSWRASILDRLVAVGVRAFFGHRHRRLRRIYG